MPARRALQSQKQYQMVLGTSAITSMVSVNNLAVQKHKYALPHHTSITSWAIANMGATKCQSE